MNTVPLCGIKRIKITIVEFVISEVKIYSCSYRYTREYLRISAVVSQAPELIVVAILDVTRRLLLQMGLDKHMYLERHFKGAVRLHCEGYFT
jgi:hypothetical protein